MWWVIEEVHSIAHTLRLSAYLTNKVSDYERH